MHAKSTKSYHTWKRVQTAPYVVLGLVAAARADLGSSEFGLADARAPGSHQVARHLSLLERQVDLVLDRADEVGRHVPVRCVYAIGFVCASNVSRSTN